MFLSINNNFVPSHAMKAQGKQRNDSMYTCILNPALDRGEWSPSRTGYLPHGLKARGSHSLGE